MVVEKIYIHLAVCSQACSFKPFFSLFWRNSFLGHGCFALLIAPKIHPTVVPGNALFTCGLFFRFEIPTSMKILKIISLWGCTGNYKYFGCSENFGIYARIRCQNIYDIHVFEDGYMQTTVWANDLFNSVRRFEVKLQQQLVTAYSNLGLFT